MSDETIEPRESIMRLARHMELCLRRHDRGKGDWLGYSQKRMFDLVRCESLELLRARDPEDIAHEAVDLACVAMMNLDKALGVTGESRGKRVADT